MDKETKKRLSELLGQVQDIRVEIEGIQVDHEDNLDELEDLLIHSTAKSERMSEINDALLEVIDYLAEAETSLENAMEL